MPVGDVQLDDLRLWNVIEILHQRPQAVAVRGNDHSAADLIVA